MAPLLGATEGVDREYVRLGAGCSGKRWRISLRESRHLGDAEASFRNN